MEYSSLTDRLKALKEPQLSYEILLQGADQFKFSFLGNAYSSKVYTVVELDKELKKLWPKSKDIFIKKEGNEFWLIKFHTHDEYEVVLKFHPWFIEGDLLVLEPWNPKIPKSKVDLTKQLFWMRLYNMQPGFVTPDIVNGIAGAMGEVKELDPPDCIIPKGKVQKALVLIDVRDPLRRGFWMKNAAGEEKWIRLFYEKQPRNLCGYCYTIDHKEAECGIIANFLLQQQRGHLSTNSILDPPAWTNPAMRGVRNVQVNMHQVHQEVEDQPSLVIENQHTALAINEECMHAQTHNINPVPNAVIMPENFGLLTSRKQTILSQIFLWSLLKIKVC
ncbi:uncharacterized protein LOC113348917 [Papaver somniferum]|uniref:uncharacterized protein LOC113348917 n=1 Tax=Papaver somniferum TaxID=3469 RepID=UPI000E6F7DFD|nr:uncharacterized protein LOC113348917 [Papaver somniferum]